MDLGLSYDPKVQRWTSLFLKRERISQSKVILSWQAEGSSAVGDNPRLLLKPKFHCRIHESATGPLLKPTSPVHTFTSCFFKIYFNINITLLRGFFSSDFPTKSSHFTSPHADYIYHPFHSPWFGHLDILIIFVEACYYAVFCILLLFPLSYGGKHVKVNTFN